MNAPESPAAPRRRTSALAWLLLLVALPLAAALGWRAWQSERDARRAADAEEGVRIEALQQRVAILRQGQQAQGKRLQQAEATNRLLRDELLAMGQRAALLEDSVQRLADPAQDAARALRLDEVELLLAQGKQRLLLAGDLQGARSAYALAARLLDALDAPADIDLRQVLADERAMLDALGADPRVAAVARLDAFEAGLDDAAGAPATAVPERDAAASAQPWWQRVASRIVDVRRSDEVLVVDAGERAAGLAALRLELSLARTAAERRDRAGYVAALARVRALVPRLWPRSAARDARLRDLDAIAALPLAVELPTLGTTFDQLRLQRGRRADARAPM
ncbi:uroporphyrinogen-III C-methyltransferase [Luteimonas sp. Sa2BVA3]|uniref:Uroporphyrinogen-III C-methyltransferase n=1 Tax=Luteimonas colneyensis TaxID=2762230 RepID=A0ABR8UHU0_9GAMM|nr:uroporphyrinogen-III C-methyltransferase [Luteimonas colneyensis]MBD7987561.1 uroporphyrinogen-III C-methyltransferase [Luteimonas colneyensis]